MIFRGVSAFMGVDFFGFKKISGKRFSISYLISIVLVSVRGL